MLIENLTLEQAVRFAMNLARNGHGGITYHVLQTAPAVYKVYDSCGNETYPNMTGTEVAKYDHEVNHVTDACDNAGESVECEDCWEEAVQLQLEWIKENYEP